MKLIFFSLFFLFSSLQAALPFVESYQNHNGTVSATLLHLLEEYSIDHDGSWESIIQETQKQWLRPLGSER